MDFEATPRAARERLHAVNPLAYAATRNHVDGKVTRLSPYLTHGLITVAEVVDHLRALPAVGANHKLVTELGWREYFRHVWHHRGAGIQQSLHPGPLPDEHYSRVLPDDVRQARTGLAVIDQSVRSLYRGWLHNHARLWLASYLVHARKIHWRVGADWMIAYLLDGDLASNHLSWQWVAGTSSVKPYLFNAENVRRFAPASWHVDGTALDTSYEQMAAIAHTDQVIAPDARELPGVEAPSLRASPPSLAFQCANGHAVAGRDVWLVHPWCLADPPRGCIRVAVCDAEFHRTHPWSNPRWRFVGERMKQIADVCWFDTGTRIVDALRSARSVSGVADPHLGSAFDPFGLALPRRAFIEPEQLCNSFSAWWTAVVSRAAAREA